MEPDHQHHLEYVRNVFSTPYTPPPGLTDSPGDSDMLSLRVQPARTKDPNPQFLPDDPALPVLQIKSLMNYSHAHSLGVVCGCF